MKNCLMVVALLLTQFAQVRANDDCRTEDDVQGRIDIPVKRNDGYVARYLDRHNSRLSRIRKHATHHFDVVFAGDSITQLGARPRETRRLRAERLGRRVRRNGSFQRGLWRRSC